jgi:predicted RNase H-like HicB family nuclease
VRRLQNHILYTVARVLRRKGIRFNEENNLKVDEMRRIIASLEGHAISFKIEQYPDGSWSAESTNIDGIMTGSNNPAEIRDMIKDAIFTYFEIPPHLCKDDLVRSDNEPITVEQRVHVGA